ncbi:hypothetical protein KRMM14A1259_72660 [Krasilnikovia sp. MM14-A1259]
MPTIHPDNRDDVPPADSYGQGARVWVHRGGSLWRPGRIDSATPMAAMVTYRPTEHRGTAVDTVTAAHLAPRTEDDPMDGAQPRPGARLPVRPRTPDRDQVRDLPAAGERR